MSKGKPYPNMQQELLIRAAVLDGEDALSAWEEWSSTWDMEDHPDNGTFRLLPLLYRNLSRLKVQDPRMMRLKGIYRQSWYKNAKLFYSSGEFLQLFHDRGIPTILLKGTALAVQYYRDFGSRPMADVDVLIPMGMAREGIDLLHEAGWKAEYEQYIEYNLRYGRSMMFYNSEGLEFDLHWCPFFESLGQVSENDFWEKAVPMEFADMPVLALCPADNLLHVIIHGVKWNPEPPIRWVTDAIAIISSKDPAVDWQRFIEQVKQHKVVLQIKQALAYLKLHFKAPIPEYVTKEIDSIPITLSERLIYKHDQKKPDILPEGFFGKLYLLYIEFLRKSEKRGFFRQLWDFFKYLRFRTRGKDRFRILWYYLTRKIKLKRARGKAKPENPVAPA